MKNPIIRSVVSVTEFLSNDVFEATKGLDNGSSWGLGTQRRLKKMIKKTFRDFQFFYPTVSNSSKDCQIHPPLPPEK